VAIAVEPTQEVRDATPARVALDRVTTTLEGGQMSSRLPTLAIVLSVLAVPLAGCGGDSTPALSTEDFVDQVATICDDLQASLDALGEPTDNAGLATLARKAGNLLSDARTAFADVAPPEALSKDYAEFLDVVDRPPDQSIADAAAHKARAVRPTRGLQRVHDGYGGGRRQPVLSFQPGHAASSATASATSTSSPYRRARRPRIIPAVAPQI
jgi:hypothetical protein